MDLEIKRMKPLLGTYVNIALVGSKVSEDASHHIINQAFAKIEKIHRLMSFHDPNSDLSRINHSDGDWVPVHPLVAKVLQLAVRMMHESQHAFNCTVGAQLVKVNALPWAEAKHHQYALVGDAFDIQIRGKNVRLKKKILITLDGIAKGYAVDLAAEVLEKADAQGYWINAGCDIRVGGDIQLPVTQREQDGSLQPLIVLRNQSLASSELREKFNPYFPSYLVGSNRSAKTGIYTIQAPRTWVADALTKVAAFAHQDILSQLLKQYDAQVLRAPQ